MNDEGNEFLESLMQFLYRAPVGLVQTNLRGDIEMMNPKAAQLLMPLSTDGNLENLFDVLRVAVPQLTEIVQNFKPNTGSICESFRVMVVEKLRGVDTSRFISLSMQKLETDSLMTMVSDVTLEAEREERELRHSLRDVSRLDSLTQMPNRPVVKEALELAMTRAPLAEGNEFAVLFMNCDRFKQINDSLGRSVGDAVLNQMAGRLRASLRLSDSIDRGGGHENIAARVGGDEFVIFIDQMLQPDDVYPIAQRLVEVLSQPYVVESHQLYCGVSMGIVMRAQAGCDADAVLRDASIAMAEAKHNGGSRYAVFKTNMQELALTRTNNEAALRLALTHSQLFVVYQPVVSLLPNSAFDPSISFH